ncbi:MAG TPA: hypothetical protein VJG65_00990 [Patescibacteria group bacterium]|nr:hypothetical protein [Patescibacteria group bacterium]
MDAHPYKHDSGETGVGREERPDDWPPRFFDLSGIGQVADHHESHDFFISRQVRNEDDDHANRQVRGANDPEVPHVPGVGQRLGPEETETESAVNGQEEKQYDLIHFPTLS